MRKILQAKKGFIKLTCEAQNEKLDTIITKELPQEAGSFQEKVMNNLERSQKRINDMKKLREGHNKETQDELQQEIDSLRKDIMTLQQENLPSQ